MLGLSVIILFKSLLHVFCSLVFSAHNSSTACSEANSDDICNWQVRSSHSNGEGGGRRYESQNWTWGLSSDSYLALIKGKARYAKLGKRNTCIWLQFILWHNICHLHWSSSFQLKVRNSAGTTTFSITIDTDRSCLCRSVKFWWDGHCPLLGQLNGQQSSQMGRMMKNPTASRPIGKGYTRNHWSIFV